MPTARRQLWVNQDDTSIAVVTTNTGDSSMTSSIVSAISDVLTPDIVNKIAVASGLDRAMTQKVIGAAVPAILSGMADAVGKPEKAQMLTNVIADLPTNGLDNIGGALAGPAKAAPDGRGILSSLLGSSAPNLLASTIARYLGISSGAAQTVLGLVVPPILSTLSHLQRANGLDSAGLARLLIKQKEAIADAMPTGLSGLLGSLDSVESTVSPAPPIPRAYEKQNARSGAAGKETDRRVTWTYWGLTLAALGGLLWALLPGGSGTHESASVSSYTPMLVPTPGRKPVYFARAAQNWRSIGATPNDYVNQPIHSADGAMLGTVRDLLVRPDGTAAAAVLSVGRQLGIGEKEVAVPISLLRMERRDSGHRLVVDVEKDMLLSAPSYEGHPAEKQ